MGIRHCGQSMDIDPLHELNKGAQYCLVHGERPRYEGAPRPAPSPCPKSLEP